MVEDIDVVGSKFYLVSDLRKEDKIFFDVVLKSIIDAKDIFYHKIYN